MDSANDLGEETTQHAHAAYLYIHKKRTAGREPETKEGMVEFRRSGPHLQKTLAGS